MNTLRQARADELNTCIQILREGRAFQQEQGFTQWTEEYPSPALIESDIREGGGWLFLLNDEPAGYMYLTFDGDPSYPDIQGAWHFDEPYAVIHRIAIDDAFRGQGLSAKIFALVEDLLRSRGVFLLRIDTHHDNKRMQHILSKNGFSYCGTVIQDNGLRLAYEKKLSK